MPTMTIRNRSSKVSPGGVITLPLAARRTLRMEIGKGARVTVAVVQGCVELRPAETSAGIRVSPKGQMELLGEPRAMLERGVLRHFWLEMDDEKRSVSLHPYAKQ